MTDGRTLAEALTAPGPPRGDRRGATSDLSIDEVLILHSVAWEPVDVVFGTSWWSVPWGSWQFQTGEIAAASQAFTGAFADASRAMARECHRVGGAGVVGVDVEVTVHSHHMNVALTGTAVRPITKPAGEPPTFMSDLSARDLALLLRAGWMPLGLAAGASFVGAQRRSAAQWMSQQTQNVELPQLTQALYQAREGAMGRMQELALSLQADGVVGVQLREGPIAHDSRFIQFVVFGTAVHLAAGSHQLLAPTMAVTMQDLSPQFQATSLSG